MNNGTLWGCGSNDNGQLTNIASTTTSLTQLTNTTGLTPILVSCGGSHTLVLMNDGTVWACGDNERGALAFGGGARTVNVLTKITNIPGTSRVIQVVTGYPYAYTRILCSNGQIYSCGDLRNSPTGNGSAGTYTSTFIATTMPTGNGIAIKMADSGTNSLLVLMSNGTIWGISTGNNNGILGLNNNTTSILSLTQMLTTNATNNNISAGIYPIDVCCGSYWTLVLYSNGTVYGTGVNFEGEIGIVGGGAFLKLTAVPGITGAVSLFTTNGVSYILTSDGSVYSSGINEFGALALGTSNHNAMLYTFTKPTSTILPKTIAYLADSYMPKNGYAGSLANLRIVVGSSVYDPNATSITTSKYQLTNVTNTKLLFLGSSYSDGSTAAHTIAPIDPSDGSVISSTIYPSDLIQNAFYFSGTNYLSITPTDIILGTGDYTIEFWFNASNFNSRQIIGTTNAGGVSVWISSTTIVIDGYGVGAATYTFPTMTANTWYNVILVRGSSTHACFLNGTKQSSVSNTGSLPLNLNGATTRIGTSFFNNNFVGYLANLRIVVGTAVYSATAANLTSTYPRTPLTSVTNTKLLLLGDSFYDLSPSSHAITNNSSVQISYSSVRYV